MPTEVFIALGGVLGILVLSLFAATLLWIYRDTQARQKSSLLWLLIVFFLWPLGVLAYYLLRERQVTL